MEEKEKQGKHPKIETSAPQETQKGVVKEIDTTATETKYRSTQKRRKMEKQKEEQKSSESAPFNPPGSLGSEAWALSLSGTRESGQASRPKGPWPWPPSDLPNSLPPSGTGGRGKGGKEGDQREIRRVVICQQRGRATSSITGKRARSSGTPPEPRTL